MLWGDCKASAEMYTRFKNIAFIIVHNPLCSILFILLCGILVYSNTLSNDFLFDDFLFIVDWPLIQDLKNFPQFFGPLNQPEGHEGVYSPLNTYLRALIYHLCGAKPLGHHLVALLIHLTGTIFVYLISLRLVSSPVIAFLCGLFFALHPVHVEAISMLAISIDMAGVVFLFISFYLYIKARQNNGLHRNYYIFSLFFTLLAIFTYELMIVAPLFFLLYDLCFMRKGSSLQKLFLRLIPYFTFACAYVCLKFMLLGTIARGRYIHDSFYLTMLVSIKAMVKYIFISFFPLYLSSFHEISKGIYSYDWEVFDKISIFSQSIFDTQVLMAIFITGFIVYFAIRAWKDRPIISFCIGWFYISLLPVSNIIPCQTHFAERYLYPGSFGFCLITAYFLFKLYHFSNFKLNRCAKFLSACLVILIFTFYSARTFMRNMNLKDELSFYKAEIAQNPTHPMIHSELGLTYLHLGNLPKAIFHLEKAVESVFTDDDAYFALAEAYKEMKYYEQAIDALEKAINLNSNFAEAYYDLAEIYGILGLTQKGQDSLTKALYYFRQQGGSSKAQLKDASENYLGFDVYQRIIE